VRVCVRAPFLSPAAAATTTCSIRCRDFRELHIFGDR
jgi:hypothetical protein